MSFETGGLRVNQQQSSKDFFQWSTTDEGRKRIGQNVILIGGVAVATVSWCWNMFLVDWMKDAYSTFDNQKRRLESLTSENKKVGALAESFQTLFTSMQSRAGLKDDTMDSIDIFYTKSLDPVSAGDQLTKAYNCIGNGLRTSKSTSGGMSYALLPGLARGSQGAVVGIPEYMLQVN